jgi:p-cumate 2,3-dioxygenase alpha subunit
VEWNDISRGMARTPAGNDEHQMRVFWREWAARMGSHAYGSAR